MNQVAHGSLLLLLMSMFAPSPGAAQAVPTAGVSFEPGDRIVYIGNTFAERMSLFRTSRRS